MTGSSHLQLCKKNSYPVKLQDVCGGFHFLQICKFSNFNFVKKNNDFGYMLPNSCFREQLSMPASEFTNKCDTRYFSVCQVKWKNK